MNAPRYRRIRVALAVAVLGTAGLAGAQDEQPAETRLQPPTPTIREDTGGGLVQAGVAILLMAAVVGANLIPSKRGHQD